MNDLQLFCVYVAATLAILVFIFGVMAGGV